MPAAFCVARRHVVAAQARSYTGVEKGYADVC